MSLSSTLEFNHELISIVSDKKRLEWYDELWPYIIIMIKDYEAVNKASEKLIETVKTLEGMRK